MLNQVTKAADKATSAASSVGKQAISALTNLFGFGDDVDVNNLGEEPNGVYRPEISNNTGYNMLDVQEQGPVSRLEKKLDKLITVFEQSEKKMSKKTKKIMKI